MDTPKVGFKKILYATDMSESGRDGFKYAAGLAHQYGAELTVFHVVEEGPDLDIRLSSYVSEELWEDIKKRDLQDAADQLVRRRRDDTAIHEVIGAYCEKTRLQTPDHPYVTYDVDVTLGQAVPEIVKKVEEGGFDLLVLGRHGHSTLYEAMHFMVGDTVRNVLRNVHVPVLVVPVPKK